jgi:plasmid maintenance system antidote protein VapI
LGDDMKMRNPPHPGEVLEELCLEPLGLSVTRAAEALGVSRKTLSAILNGRAGNQLRDGTEVVEGIWHVA